MGLTYNLYIKMSGNGRIEHKRINAKEAIEHIKNDLKQYYDIDEPGKISPQVLYDLRKRPKNCSKLLKYFVFLEVV